MHERQQGESLAMFAVDRLLPGMTEENLAEAHRLLQEAARRVSSKGEPVRHVRCFYLPEDRRCICLFEAKELVAVREVNAIAQVPFRRISSAIESAAPGVSEETGVPTGPFERRLNDNA